LPDSSSRLERISRTAAARGDIEAPGGKGRLDESSRQVVVREEATGRTVAG
jgi:hypothetical protein